jgi:hypothetical protein
MSATILAFKPRSKPEPESVKQPAPNQLEISKFECDHLDRVIDRAVHVLDVIHSGPALIKQFLAGQRTIASTVKHGGVEYELQISLVEKHSPRFA